MALLRLCEAASRLGISYEAADKRWQRGTLPGVPDPFTGRPWIVVEDNRAHQRQTVCAWLLSAPLTVTEVATVSSLLMRDELRDLYPNERAVHRLWDLCDGPVTPADIARAGSADAS